MKSDKVSFTKSKFRVIAFDLSLLIFFSACFAACFAAWSTAWSSGQLIGEPVGQFIGQFIGQSISQSISQSIRLPTSDPLFYRQWALYNDGSQTINLDFDNLHSLQQKAIAGVDIGWLEAQEQISHFALKPVIIAVIDSGLDVNHPDLVGRILPDGFDFLNQSSVMSDPTGHGTEVTGVIAANTNNGIGISGIAPSTIKILPLRILGRDGDYQNFSYKGKLLSDYAADAIRYAIAHKASVINMSLGWPKLADNLNIRKAILEAEAAGVLIVAAAGNDRKSNPSFPCSYDAVICVGSVSNNATMAYYSNLGGIVDILAPGDDVISTFPLLLESKVLRMQAYESVRGTSISAPIVSAIAGTLRSVYPNISLAELRARIFLSSDGAPILKTKDNSSLFGLVHLARAISVTARPVFYPHFKGFDEVSVDEVSLIASGKILVENLWAPATAVSGKVFVNGKLAGQAHIKKLSAGQSFAVDWEYKFSSLEESSLPKMILQISYAAGGAQTFALDLTCVRKISKIARQKVLRLTEVDPASWLPSSNGFYYSTLRNITTYGESSGAPRYYFVSGGDENGSDLQIFDPTIKNPVNKVRIPEIQKVFQVLRIDLRHDGNMSWVVTGTRRTANQAYFVFYFMDANFKKLHSTNSASTWQYSLESNFGGLVPRDYSLPGSWIEGASGLIPCFFANGLLPSVDNYDGLDPRHYQAASHFYYLLPQANTTVSLPTALEIRVLDNKKWRDSYDHFYLQNLIPQSNLDQKMGHIRILIALGTNVDAENLIWDLPSVTVNRLFQNSGWDVLSASGLSLKVLSLDMANRLSTFSNFFDQITGSLTWVNSDGRFLGRNEYSFKSLENQMTGQAVVGAFSLSSLGNIWFVQTRFDLVAFHQSVNNVNADFHVTSLDRDSTFATQQYQSLLTPVIVGTVDLPMPGLFIDSTLVRGDLLSIALLNPQTLQMQKPLRYSLQVPEACVEMTSFYETSSIESFSLALLCRKNAQLEFRTLQFQ